MIENRVFPKFPLPDFKVAVRCITYNHAPYITDALKGFVMQKTDFPFITIVIDDSSTDGEQGVIEKYMKEEFSLKANSECEIWETSLSKMIYARHPLNKECYFVVLLLKRNLYKRGKVKCSLYFPWIELCKYWAECEGDDYWIDPLKLQKQVDYLEAHPECGLVYTSCKRYLQENNVFLLGQERLVSFNELVLDNVIHTATVLLVKKSLDQYFEEITPHERKWKMSDYPIWLFISATSSIGYLSAETAVYRVLKESASHSVDYHKNYDFIKSVYEIRLFFIKRYGPSPFLLKQITKIFVSKEIELSLVSSQPLRENLIPYLLKNKICDLKMIILCLLLMTSQGLMLINWYIRRHD